MYYNNKRLFLSLFWIVVGAVLILLSCLEVLPSTMYSGMGGGLIAVGVMQVLRNLKYRKNEEYKEKVDIELTDERSRFLRMKAWAVTGYIVVLTQGIGIIIAMVAGQQLICQILAYSVCLILIVYWIVYLVLNKKY